jgi:cytochrome c5
MTSVLNGKNAMPARGGSNPADISDYELGRAAVYMANAAGGKLPEPKASAAK